MSKMSTTLAVLGVVAGLGVAALPLSTYAANDATHRDVPLSLTVEPVLQISTSSDVAGDPVTVSDVVLSAANAGDTAEFASSDFKVNVKTNNSLGYTISIKPTTATKTALESDAGDTIPAKVLTTGESAWAYKVVPGKGGAATANGNSTTTNWTALIDGDTVIYTATQEAGGIDKTSGVDTPVTFGATVADSQAAGTYKGSVTFTAAATVAEP